MSKNIGITGGIGTGKSFVARIFKTLGIPFYDADSEAKTIMNTSDSLKQALISTFGAETYLENGALNRKWLAAEVFNNNDKLKLLNSLVHPVVIEAGKNWAEQQTAVYTLKEAALLFESQSYKLLDATILVTAPLELRIARVMDRDKVSREEVMRRIEKQMPEADKLKLADFVIINDGITPLLPQIEKIHSTIINR